MRIGKYLKGLSQHLPLLLRHQHVLTLLDTFTTISKVDDSPTVLSIVQKIKRTCPVKNRGFAH